VNKEKQSKEKYGKKSVWPGVILIAFVAAIGTFFLLLHIEKNALSAYEKTLVWVTKAQLVKGLEITEAGWMDCFEQIEIDKNKIPAKLVENPQALIGMQAVMEIPQGSIVTTPMFTGEEAYVLGMFNPVVAGCKGDDLFQMVSGVLRKGDLVNLYTVNEELEETYLLWERVMVYQVFDTAGNSIAAEDTTTPAARVNLLLEEGYAEQFYKELSQGSLRMVKLWE